MRASPPLQVTVRRFGLWRGAVTLLLGAALASMLAFVLARGESAPVHVRHAAIAASSAILWGGISLLRCSPISLRWDTRRWRLGPASTVGEEPFAGGIEVCLDFGTWLLLRFEHDVTVRGRRSTWLPIQRRGLEAQWHALRCAVYSSRPTRGPDGGRLPARSPQSQE